MSGAVDHLVERRRLRRRLSVWRVLAILALAVAAAAFFWREGAFGPYVARHTVFGVIFEDPDRDAMLRELAEDPQVEALILRIDSPGGTAAGSESLFDAVRTVAARKPVVAVMGEAATSGGYIAALAAERIYARGSSITGSIGVIAQYPNISELLDDIGVTVEKVASTPLKAEPNPLTPVSEAALAAQEAVIADSYDWFLGLVSERRDLSPERARELGDGRIYTGRQALETGLIDAIGAEPEARSWLSSERAVDPEAPLRDVFVERGESVADFVFGAGAADRALDALARRFRVMALAP